MKCNCISRLENDLKQAFINSGKEYIHILSVDMNNKLEKVVGETQLYLPVVVRYKTKTKKGNIVVRTYSTNIPFKYCPYCGSLIEEANAE